MDRIPRGMQRIWLFGSLLTRPLQIEAGLKIGTLTMAYTCLTLWKESSLRVRINDLLFILAVHGLDGLVAEQRHPAYGGWLSLLSEK